MSQFEFSPKIVNSKALEKLEIKPGQLLINIDDTKIYLDTHLSERVLLNKETYDKMLSDEDRSILDSIVIDGDGQSLLTNNGEYITIESLVDTVLDSDTISEINDAIEKLSADNMIDWENPFTVPFAGLPVGYVAKDMSVKELLYEATHPFVAPTIGISISEGAGTFQLGTQKRLSVITVSSYNGSIGAFTENDPEIYINNVLYQIQANDIVEKTPTKYKLTLTNPIVGDGSTTINIKAIARIKTAVLQATTGYVFVKPVYYGTTTDPNISETEIKTKTKVVRTKGQLSYKFTGTAAYSFIAYDKTWGRISKITDPNGFNITPNYTTREITIDGQSYYLVISNGISSITNFTITFSF